MASQGVQVPEFYEAAEAAALRSQVGDPIGAPYPPQHSHHERPVALNAFYRPSCMYCDRKVLPGKSLQTCIIHDLGIVWFCCSNDICCNKMQSDRTFWHANVAFGDANYLMKRNIKILRSNGVEEFGWRLWHPIVQGNAILCRKDEQENRYSEKWVLIADILALNPEACG